MELSTKGLERDTLLCRLKAGAFAFDITYIIAAITAFVPYVYTGVEQHGIH